MKGVLLGFSRSQIAKSRRLGISQTSDVTQPIAGNLSTIEGSEEQGGSCVVAEGLTKVGEVIDIPRAKNEAAPQLKRM
jgi:hypothetical protein